MRSQHLILSPLLGLTHALTLPKNAVASLTQSEGTAKLNWGDCDEFPQSYKDHITWPIDCAKLEVPLDYTSLSSGETIDLQLVRIKATKKPVKGSVLYNPGGPGASGVETVALGGQDLRDVLGGHYNVIGFDPRGTGRTIPFICGNKTDSSSLHRRKYNSLPQADLWGYVKNELWKNATKTSDSCYKNQQDYGRYIGTAFVARDLISIVDALDEGGKLNYWGTSYGTVLGQVAAAMFPDRMGRVMLDAVLAAESYLADSWVGGAEDTERALLNLFSECIAAGAELCPLANYTGDNTTPQSLMDALGDLFEELKNVTEVPKDVGFTLEDQSYGGNSMIVEIKGKILEKLYSPMDFPVVLKIVYNSLQRNWKEALNVTATDLTSPWNLGTDSYLGISCGDSSYRVDDPEDLYSFTQAHLAQSSFADSLLLARATCARWRFSAAEKVDKNILQNVRTSFPILFVNGIYDPITPISHAWEASARYRDSRVIVHEGAGHGLTAHPSNCTNKAVQEYFDDGKIPEVGTVCKPNMSAFEYIQAEAAKAEGDNE
ncbi:hypothetical protein ACJ41O_001544 [Fusarium nematophilum]